MNEIFISDVTEAKRIELPLVSKINLIFPGYAVLKVLRPDGEDYVALSIDKDFGWDSTDIDCLIGVLKGIRKQLK